MLFQLNFPTQHHLDALIIQQKDKPFSYPKSDNLSLREMKQLRGFNYDSNRILLGEGDAVFKAASQAIRQWTMFPGGWARIYSDTTPIEVGRVVAMCARVMGLWWLNCSRIVYTVNEPNRFGFAYGTLYHHAESGEELFQVKMYENGQVYYEIQAFSRPRHWMARLGFPLARYYQRQFVKDSLKNMKKVTDELLQTDSELVR